MMDHQLKMSDALSRAVVEALRTSSARVTARAKRNGLCY